VWGRGGRALGASLSGSAKPLMRRKTCGYWQISLCNLQVSRAARFAQARWRVYCRTNADLWGVIRPTSCLPTNRTEVLHPVAASAFVRTDLSQNAISGPRHPNPAVLQAARRVNRWEHRRGRYQPYEGCNAPPEWTLLPDRRNAVPNATLRTETESWPMKRGTRRPGCLRIADIMILPERQTRGAIRSPSSGPQVHSEGARDAKARTLKEKWLTRLSGWRQR
jgi:hypothetical protein